jgi:hypothetical protein
MSANTNRNTKVAKSISITQGTIDDVTDTSLVWKSYDFSTKVQSIIEILHSVVNYTKLELKNKFTESEAKVLCDALNGFIFTTGMSPILQVYHTVNDAIQFNRIHVEHNVDPKELGEKLLKLTAAQAYTLSTVVIQYWNASLDEEPNFDNTFGFLYKE